MFKKIGLLLLVLLAIGCEDIYDGSAIRITVNNYLGNVYKYDLSLDGDLVGTGYHESSEGLHTVTLDLYDPSGVYISSTEKMVILTGYSESVTFNLYFIGDTEVGTE